jgi:hypothetical protein
MKWTCQAQNEIILLPGHESAFLRGMVLPVGWAVLYYNYVVYHIYVQ